MYRILYRFLAALASLAVHSGRSKDLEIIVLRHQLMVLRRQDDRPQLNDGDRTLLGAIAAALPRPEGAENASLQVTGLATGTVTGRVIARLAPVPAADRSSRAAVGGR